MHFLTDFNWGFHAIPKSVKYYILCKDILCSYTFKWNTSWLISYFTLQLEECKSSELLNGSSIDVQGVIFTLLEFIHQYRKIYIKIYKCTAFSIIIVDINFYGFHKTQFWGNVSMWSKALPIQGYTGYTKTKWSTFITSQSFDLNLWI